MLGGSVSLNTPPRLAHLANRSAPLPCDHEPNLTLAWREPSARRGQGSGKPVVRKDTGADLPGAVLARDSCGHGSATVLVKAVAEEHFCGRAKHVITTVLPKAVLCCSLVASLAK